MTGDQLSDFIDQVLSQPTEQLLPQHLSDYWLDALGHECNDFHADGTVGPALLATVIRILHHQLGYPSPDTDISVPIEQQLDNVTAYVMAVTIEELRRRTPFKGDLPTLDNIFARGDLTFRYQPATMSNHDSHA